MRGRRGLITAGVELVLAVLLAAAAGLGLWQLNRPLPEANAVMLREVPTDAVVVDARGPLAFRQGHLPEARRLWARDLLSFGDAAGSLAEPEALEAKVRSLGVQPGRQLVVYDDGDGEEAALVVLVLRAFGHDARFLRGGVRDWQRRGGSPVEGPEEAAADEVNGDAPESGFDRRLIVAPEEAHLHIAENEVAPLDVRDREAYAAGHLEGAVNVPASELLPGGEPPRWSVLSRALGPARITRDTHPLVYGEDAAQAATAWLALAAYGVQHVHVLPAPYPTLVSEGFAVSETATPAATSTRSSSVCWR